MHVLGTPALLDRIGQVRESGDISREEGDWRSNLASTLLKLKRFDEARQEIFRVIECKSHFDHAVEPLKSWALLARVETDACSRAASADPMSKGIACYLADRRDGRNSLVNRNA